MSLEALKERTNGYLESLGIETNPNLPLIEGLEEVKPRSAQDVAGRVCAIAYVVRIGFGANRTELIGYLRDFGLWKHVSDYEKSLLVTVEISEQDRINMEWMTECIQALGWAIYLVELDPFKHCDDDLASKIPYMENPSDFINSACLRPIEEIQEQSDLYYRLNWYTKKCRREDKEGLLSWGIILERRKAIDWLYGVEQDWDEVPLDT